MSTRPLARRTPLLALGAAGLLALGACAPADDATTDTDTTTDVATTDTTDTGTAGDDATSTDDATGDADATATLMNAEGDEVGSATFTETGSAVRVEAQVEGLDAGFYGFHIHGIGLCEPDSAAPNNPDNTGAFLSAGGHLGGGGDTPHPEHAGDLPSLLVLDDGTAHLVFDTDRFTLAEIDDEDGAALMLHAGTDNFANIPDRYAADGVDEDTTNTGDAGGRQACGVIEHAG